MSQGQSQAVSTVLVFESDPSLRRIITLGLVHRGLHVIEADSLAALAATDANNIDLLVLDVDDTLTCDWQLLDTIQAQPRFSSTATVVLAWDPPATGSDATTSLTHAQTAFLPKPFDARTLHETVDQLICARIAEQKAREAQIEAALLASYANHAAPSPWPVLTAAGLFLLVIGLLLQLALAIVGALVVVVGLLLWTLGGQPAATNVTLGT